MTARDLWFRFRAVAFRRAVDRELEDELTFHLAMQTRKNLAAGLLEASGSARKHS
jgi:hypothetical protein